MCPGELRCRNTLGSFRCEFDETRVIDTVHNPVIDEPTFNDINESNENSDTAGRIVSIFQPAPVSRGSDYPEDFENANERQTLSLTNYNDPTVSNLYPFLKSSPLRNSQQKTKSWTIL